MRSPHGGRYRVFVHSWILLAVPLLVVSAACDDDDPTGPQATSFDWTGTIDAGDRLEILGVNGTISASRAAGATASVVAQLHGNGDDVTTVSVEVVEHEGGAILCAIYPDVPGEPANRCDPDEPEVHGNSRVSVDFVVQVPVGVDYSAVVVNGDLTATGLTQPAGLVTVNGSIDASTTSALVAVTVNGSIDATLDAAELLGPWTLATVNGSIAARLPGTVDATVVGTVANGEISSDFPLTETAPGEWTGTIGAGGTPVTMATVNGNLDLVRIP